MNRGRFLVLCAVAGVFSCTASVTSGHGQLAPRTVDQLTVESGSIVHAHVERVASAWNASGDQIFTEVDIKVVESFKGDDQADDVIRLRILGGTVGDIRMTIIGQPVFRDGEEVLVYLLENRRHLLPVTGMHEGKLTIAVDAQTGERVVFAEHLEAEPFDAYRTNLEIAVFEYERVLLPDGQLLAPRGLPEIADPSVDAVEGGGS